MKAHMQNGQAAVVAESNAQNSAREKQKMTFTKIVFLYMLGGLVGTVWETVFKLCRGRGFVYSSGSLLTPFNFVYGTGAVAIVLGMRNLEKWWQIYLAGALGGGIVEYTLSFLEELILGTRSWNYENRLLNINGRTTLPYMAFWGLLCLAVIFWVYRPLNRWMDTLPQKTLQIVAIVAAVVIVADFLVTASALLRYTGRHAGKSARTALGR
ncbi:MAG: putative ABC transporter permease, partial [Clostridiales bacterium]|nr:putative ABC transporter permease [Clostridiales bacterium]